jgi:hypothetical protein
VSLKECCRREAKLRLAKHRDVATCDDCGALVLAYGNLTDFRNTVAELERHGLDYDMEQVGSLYIVARPS